MSQSLKNTAWLKNLCKALVKLFSLTVGQPVCFTSHGLLANYVPALGTKAVYEKTTAGAQTLLAAAAVDREIHLLVTVNETFADNTGAKSSFGIGETSAATKFKAGLNSGNAGDKIPYDGTLSAGKALLVTGTAATGDGAGGIDVSVIAVPLAS